jgi:hypothetical protein
MSSDIRRISRWARGERRAAPEYEPKRRRIYRGDRGKRFDDMEILFDQRRA